MGRGGRPGHVVTHQTAMHSPSRPKPTGDRYRNHGNREALALLPAAVRRVLDVGCGAGDNARIMAAAGRSVTAITWSPEEAALAAPHVDRVVIADVERDDLPLERGTFDAIFLSHFIEHVHAPAAVLAKLAPLLAKDGVLLIAVPNMAFWRLRWRFLCGNWRREDTGPLDRTHLQFWSYLTAPELLSGTGFRVVRHEPGQLSVPLWPLRRVVPDVCSWVDSKLGPTCPNLFAGQVLLAAVRDG